MVYKRNRKKTGDKFRKKIKKNSNFKGCLVKKNENVYTNVIDKELSKKKENTLSSSYQPVISKWSLLQNMLCIIRYPLTFLSKVWNFNASGIAVQQSNENELITSLENRIRILEKRVSKLENSDASNNMTQSKESNTNQEGAKKYRSNQFQNTPASPPPLSILIPAPPPPPPPPPLPPLLLQSSISQIQPRKRSNKKEKGTEVDNKKNTKFEITAESLKAVTLKKRTIPKRYSDKENKTPPCLTVADVMNAQLKVSRKGNAPKGTSTPNLSGTIDGHRKSGEMKRNRNKTPENVFRKHLRKSNIVRSPGGTPLTSNKKSYLIHGEGLTPLLSNALKKKFIRAIPRSPLSLIGNEISNSPTQMDNSFDD